MKRGVIIALAAVLGLSVLAGLGLYSNGRDLASEQGPQIMNLHGAPKALPVVRFQDGDGRPRTLADFTGKVVLLNIWATWCGPCRHEMPTLDRLQGRLGGPEFEVLALSIDRGGPDVVRKFFAEIGVQHLGLYIDPSAKAGHALKAIGLPVTLLLDREGQEIGRLIGPAEWDTAEMVAFFETIIAGRRTAQAHANRNVLALQERKPARAGI